MVRSVQYNLAALLDIFSDQFPYHKPENLGTKYDVWLTLNFSV